MVKAGTGESSRSSCLVCKGSLIARRTQAISDTTGCFPRISGTRSHGMKPGY